MFYILRRHGLGNGSTKAIQQYSQHPITILRSDNLPVLNNKDTVLRWGCTTSIPCHVDDTPKVLNNTKSIHYSNNKKEFRLILQIKHPEITPKTWLVSEDEKITFPCIIRPQNHAQGKHLYLCSSYTELLNTCNKFTFLDTGYISKYIPKVAEYRVCFIQGLVAWVAQKTPKDPQDIAWNVAQGSRFNNLRWKQWPISVIEAAYKAYILSGLYLGGVDVMVDKDGRSFVLEINSAPSHTSPYRQQCTTKCIDYGITNNNFKHLQPNEEFKKYGKWLHPALK